MSTTLDKTCSEQEVASPPWLAEAVPAGWMPMLVRTEDYLPVATLVAAREAQRQGTHADRSDPAPQHTSAHDGLGLLPPPEFDPQVHLVPWPVEQFKALIKSSFTTAQRWVKAMDVATEHEGRLLSSDQIAAMTGMPIEAWRDAPRKITRHLDAHYSVPGWPLYAVGGRKLGREDQVYWGISAEQAARWRQARQDACDDGTGSEL